jgi:hypothetical protein
VRRQAVEFILDGRRQECNAVDISGFIPCSLTPAGANAEAAAECLVLAIGCGVGNPFRSLARDDTVGVRGRLPLREPLVMV